MINLSRTLRRTHISSVMVYKCALATASGKIKLVHYEKIIRAQKGMYVRIRPSPFYGMYIPFSLGMKNFFSQAEKKIGTR